MRALKRILYAMILIIILFVGTTALVYMLLFLGVRYQPDLLGSGLEYAALLPSYLKYDVGVPEEYIVWIRVFLAAGTVLVITMTLVVRFGIVFILAAMRKDLTMLIRWFAFYTGAVFLAYAALAYIGSLDNGVTLERWAEMAQHVPPMMIDLTGTSGHTALLVRTFTSPHTVVALVAILIARLSLSFVIAPFFRRGRHSAWEH